MREDEVKKSFAEHLKKKKIEFVEEVNLGGCVIDFLIKLNNKWIGVEVKGDRANEIHALGQIINYYTYLSHLVLCTTKEFASRFFKKIKNNPEIRHLGKKLGVWIVGENIISISSNIPYYFRLRKTRQKKKKYKYPKYGILDPIDKKILNLIDTNGTITLGEIIRATNLSYEAARKRIKNLEYFKYIKIINKYPISIRRVKYQKRSAIPQVQGTTPNN